MADPGYTPDPDSIVSAADVLRAYLEREAPDVARQMFNADIEGMAMALDRAGRLLPADAKTQWGWLSTDGATVYASPSERAARTAASRSGARKLMRRRAGPWLPAPTTDTEETP